MERIGKCQNIGPCPLATSGQIQIFTDDSAEFKCTSCGAELTEINEEPVVTTNGNSNTKKKIIAGVFALAVIAIGSGMIYFFNPSKTEVLTDSTGTKITTESLPSQKQTASETETTSKPESTEKSKTITQPEASNTYTLQVAGGSYKGEIKDGKPNGLGRVTYNSTQLISKRDMKQRKAENGDYVSGEFHEGELVQGKWFDKTGKQKGVLIIGKP